MATLNRLATAVACACIVGNALAADTEDPGAPFAKENFSVTAAVTSNYVFRAISVTDNDPAFQASVDWAWNGFYVGAWGSMVDEAATVNADLELDYYIGYAGELPFGLSFDVAAVYYTYPGSDDDDVLLGVGESDYLELIPQLSYTFTAPLDPTVNLLYAYTPDYFGETGTGHAWETSLGLTLPQEFGLNILGGHQTFEGTGAGVGDGWNYSYWSIGATKSIAGFDLDLSYVDANDNAARFLGNADIAGDHVIFTIARTFGF